MNKNHPTDHGDEVARNTLTNLLSQQQSAILSTANADASPLASYAPFVTDSDRNFYIFTSMLSHHTANLLRTGHASVMLIADESETVQNFARSRETYSCAVQEITRDGDTWHTAARLYEKRFVEMFKLLCGLSDFRMFKLTPQSGTLVVGFGAAYTLHGDGLSQLVLRDRRKR